MYQQTREACHVESLGYMKADVEARQFDRDEYLSEERNNRPGYVPRTMLESSCYPKQIADIHHEQNINSRVSNRVAFNGGQVEPSRWRSDIYGGQETNGGHKKMLTPTSSDERKRTKKRIATEDRILMRTTSNGEYGVHQLTSSNSSPIKPNSHPPNAGSFHYQGVEDIKSNGFQNSQHLNRTPQSQSSSNTENKLASSESNQSFSPRRMVDVSTHGKVRFTKTKFIIHYSFYELKIRTLNSI